MPVMDDSPLDVAAKIIDSKTAQKFYKDTIQPAAKQAGEIGQDVLKTFHLFLAPIQLLAAAQDRFRRILDKVRGEVPPERQTEAPASIAGPVLMNLRFIEDENPLHELYLNLLTRAIDKDRQKEAHPGFIKIIEQMSPDEVRTFHDLNDVSEWQSSVKASEVSIGQFYFNVEISKEEMAKGLHRLSDDWWVFSMAAKRLQHHEPFKGIGLIELAIHLQRLQSLTLVGIYRNTQWTSFTEEEPAAYVGMTPFGRQFLGACFKPPTAKKG